MGQLICAQLPKSFHHTAAAAKPEPTGNAQKHIRSCLLGSIFFLNNVIPLFSISQLRPAVLQTHSENQAKWQGWYLKQRLGRKSVNGSHLPRATRSQSSPTNTEHGTFPGLK